jgi:hypothetical protein
MGWIRVFLLGVFAILPAKILAPIMVLFTEDDHPIWGNDERVISYWDSAFRNGAFNLLNKPMVEYITTGNTNDDTLEGLDGFQWRYRKSLDGKYVSFRMTWGKPRKSKGKREFYIGWTMRPGWDYMGLTFFQLRLF